VFFQGLRNFLVVFADEEGDLELRLWQNQDGRRMELEQCFEEEFRLGVWESQIQGGRESILDTSINWCTLTSLIMRAFCIRSMHA
jgi:hypothetical protein